jgi:hypothetical protein
MAVRDAAIADIIPKMTELEGYGGGGGPSRLIYNLGHAVFEYIEAKFGKEGIRQFLFSLRKSVIGGGEDAYEEALRMKKDEFDQNFERYLKDRFKPFRDKERPADYGRDLSPNKEKTKFAEALSIAPSPSGDLIAVVTVNRKDQELDIILVSSKDGSIVRNLTGGFDKDLGFDHLVQMGVDQAANPWMAWSPKGDRLAYFVRTEKERTLIIQNVLTRDIEERIPMKMVDEPESPNFSPDGRSVAFNALQNAVGDIFALNLETKAVTNLTADPFGDRAPSYSPDGKFLVYTGQRQRETVPAGSGYQEEDADHLRHPGRDRGAVHRRSHDHLRVDRDRSLRAPRARGRAQRQHPQHLDARSDQRRAAPVHRRGRRQLVADCAERRQDQPGGVCQLLQERVQHPHARTERAAAHRRLVRLRRTRADHRLPGAAAAHARRRKQPQEEDVREDVPRGPAAGERRRDQQRRHLRRDAGQLRRRAR